MTSLTDRRIELGEARGLDASEAIVAVRAAMAEHPGEAAAQQRACAALGTMLATLLPVDAEGLLVNAIVEHVERTASVHRVHQICAKFDLGERSLQRLVSRRVGLSPKWLIQRRRLHEATERLAAGTVDLARLATELGYADQSHFTHDFHRATGVTPGIFATQRRGE